MTEQTPAADAPQPTVEIGTMNVETKRRVGVIGALLGALILLVYVWVLWVAGAIAYSYGLDVIRWATASS